MTIKPIPKKRGMVPKMRDSLFTDVKPEFGYEDIYDDFRHMCLAVQKLAAEKYPDYRLSEVLGERYDEYVIRSYLARGLYEPVVELVRSMSFGWQRPTFILLREIAREQGRESELLALYDDKLVGGKSELVESLQSMHEDGPVYEADGQLKMPEDEYEGLLEAYEEACGIYERVGDTDRAIACRAAQKVALARDFGTFELPPAESIDIDENTFWQILHDTYLSDSGEDIADSVRRRTLRSRVERLDVTSIGEFAKHYEKAWNKVSDHRVWQFAILYLGGCGDSCFFRFRESLIALGRADLIDAVIECPLDAAKALRAFPSLDLEIEYGIASMLDSVSIARGGKAIDWEFEEDYRGEFIEEEDIDAHYPEFFEWLEKNPE